MRWILFGILMGAVAAGFTGCASTPDRHEPTAFEQPLRGIARTTPNAINPQDLAAPNALKTLPDVADGVGIPNAKKVGDVVQAAQTVSDLVGAVIPNTDAPQDLAAQPDPFDAIPTVTEMPNAEYPQDLAVREANGRQMYSAFREAILERCMESGCNFVMPTYEYLNFTARNK